MLLSVSTAVALTVACKYTDDRHGTRPRALTATPRFAPVSGYPLELTDMPLDGKKTTGRVWLAANVDGPSCTVATTTRLAQTALLVTATVLEPDAV